jgi:hypothetical protein
MMLKGRMKMEINRELAAKVLSVVDAGLVRGVGNPRAGEMCVEAAVCFAMGLPHGDEPTCVSPALRKLKINLNDRDWSSNDARAKGLRRLSVIQLGTKDTLNDVEFAKRVSEMSIRVSVPIALRAAASMKGNIDHRAALLAAADRCEKEGTIAAANAAAYAANAAAYAANVAADAAYAAASAAANAAYAAADAVYAAASAAAYAANAAADAANVAARQKIRDKHLADFAENVVQILVSMGVPSAEFLELCPLGE